MLILSSLSLRVCCGTGYRCWEQSTSAIGNLSWPETQSTRNCLRAQHPRSDGLPTVAMAAEKEKNSEECLIQSPSSGPGPSHFHWITYSESDDAHLLTPTFQGLPPFAWRKQGRRYSEKSVTCEMSSLQKLTSCITQWCYRNSAINRMRPSLCWSKRMLYLMKYKGQ